MIWEFPRLLLGIHILLAMIWVGGILFIGWGVYPAINKMKIADQRLFLQTLMKKTHWLFTLAGVGVITTGTLLGTVVGPIRKFDDLFNSTFGNIWLSALIIALLTLAWGILIGYRSTMKVLSDDKLWHQAETGDPLPLNKAMSATTIKESVEVFGFIVLLGLMLFL